MSNLQTLRIENEKEPATRWTERTLGWIPWSQRSVALVGALWAFAFTVVLGLSIYLHVHPTAQLPGDLGLITLIQQIHQPLLVRFINLASDANWPIPAGVGVFLVIAALALFRRWRAALVALIAGFLADFASFSLNSWVHRPRPHDVRIHAVANIGLGSFPSGHVAHVTAFYGFLLYLATVEMRAHPRWKPWLIAVQGICGYFLLFIGVSRLLEGEHWPSDVLASYLLGGMALVGVILLYEWLGVYWERRKEHAAAKAAGDAAHQTEHAVKRAADTEPVKLYARFGYGAKAIVYLIIGGMALASALGLGGGITDQNGATHVIYQQPFGAFLLIVAALGWLGYALWCFLRAALDTEGKGTDAKGIVARVGYAAVGVIYASLALIAFGLATGKSSGGKSSNAQTQDWTARLLNLPVGPAVVVLVGLITLAIAGVLLYRAFTADFRQQLLLGKAPLEAGKGVVLLGRLGYSALGVIFAIIGAFFIVAALQHNPAQAKGLSGALGALLQEPYGFVLLGIVALGLLAYGVYSLAQARLVRVEPA
jgi:membrane-associated phospholipid phosphatase